ncbi:MAG: hypothetical protein Q8Q09_27785 [Deltaproteobacteria bacterium]|nr:hypothetical protein [Deltaproteobacteria bacterium]
MAIEAIALLKFTPAQIEAAFPAQGSTRPGADGQPLKLSALEDAVLLTLNVSFDLEPDEAGALLRKRLGSLLDSHTDSRGVLVLPDRAKPRSKTYDDAIDEVGELGFWAKKVDKDYKPAARTPRAQLDEDLSKTLSDDNTLGAQMQAMMGGFSPDMMAQAQAMLGSPQGADLFAMAQQQLQAMMSQPGGMDALAKGLSEVMGAQNIDAGQLKAMLPEKMPTPEEMKALFEQGSKDFENIAREDPSKVKELTDKFGSLLDSKEPKKS